MFQFAVEYPSGDPNFIECGLIITDLNWYNTFTITVRATVDNVIDEDAIIPMDVIQTEIIGDVEATSITKQTYSVSGSFYYFFHA